MKKLIVICLLAPFSVSTLSAQDITWPKMTTEAKPAARWWWMGSAVDKINLTHNLEMYAKAGMGTMEVTPIYGVKGNDANEISFLSPQWMQMLRHTESEAARLGMQIDMNTGTGWPFGGPEVAIEDAACKLFINEYKLKGGERLKEKIEVSDEKQRPYAKLSRLIAYPVSSDSYSAIQGSSSAKKGGRSTHYVDLTSFVKDGFLQWKAPKGQWHIIAAFSGKTLQKVKRAAPGGEGYVMNHFSEQAVYNYLKRFEAAFSEEINTKEATPYPHNFFNDSYEVYKADWTDDLFDQFAIRRGYKLEGYLPEFLSDARTDVTCRIVSDYRQTLAELLQENFTRQWTNWAHSHGTRTRNQAHGSPGNLIDLYATVDVPECEGFGLSDFGIRGLRKDSLTRPNDSDLSMLKYASSAAHIAGKPYTSSETFTWLTEHFRTSLSQCKPDIDLMFVSGVNHTYFHGTTYSPEEVAWPGWKFYASIDMSPANNIWKDAPAFFDYITRCQSFLQMGQPDNDFLVYLPVYDMWQEQEGRLLMFDIHKMAKRAPRFIEAVHRINDAGYDMDYISDNFIRTSTCQDGKIVTSGGAAYKALIIPGAKLMPEDVLEKLLVLTDQGATIVFLDQYPEDVPGFSSLEQRRTAFKETLAQIKKREEKILSVVTPAKAVQLMNSHKGHLLFGTDYIQTLAATAAIPEVMKTEYGLSCIRRSNPDGHHYFISALKAEDTEQWVPLAVHARSAMFYNPMNGASGKARIRRNGKGSEVLLQLRSGESILLKTFAETEIQAEEWGYYTPVSVKKDMFDRLGVTNASRADILSEARNLLPEDQQIYLDKWDFRFVEAVPAVTNAPERVISGSWTDLPAEGVKNTMATACYSTSFFIKNSANAVEWMLDLGDVRESARVRINGKEVATLFAVPFQCLIGKYLCQGKNTLEIEVTNLPANRIADMDRRHIEWRNFKDANIVNIHYDKSDYANWKPVSSGLLGPVRILPMKMLEM